MELVAIWPPPVDEPVMVSIFPKMEAVPAPKLTSVQLLKLVKLSDNGANKAPDVPSRLTPLSVTALAGAPFSVVATDRSLEPN